ncbi:hypothetical protein [Oceanobacillus halotolerans]|uniref:hypothetical protein n=1 Tax=Oceanobacillus halotolerans TaxID=2663380 RepID=UPI0013DA0C70|nr:hypothetical protein [Oceanobacillus halotolerans]
MDFYKVTGIIFIIMSGFLYTLENGFSILATSIVRAGFYAGTMTGGVPEVEGSGLFDNTFVPLFLIIGLVCFSYGYKKSPNTN